MKKLTKHEFSGKCEHCGFQIETTKADFTGGIGTGKLIGFYTKCPKCRWETIIALKNQGYAFWKERLDSRGRK